ncbi:MAG: hypothetical protein GX660_21650 [Clostridiaceae bacterium]|nr:hypothetical protein [Clostridiaceae bacterium]
MEKVMQPKKSIKLTEAEKKVLLAYSSHTANVDLKHAPNQLLTKSIMNY